MRDVDFDAWWDKNTIPQLMGNLEVRLYHGVPKDTAREIWEALLAQQSGKLTAKEKFGEFYIENGVRNGN